MVTVIAIDMVIANSVVTVIAMATATAISVV
jgi:hypothetical protein